MNLQGTHKRSVDRPALSPRESSRRMRDGRTTKKLRAEKSGHRAESWAAWWLRLKGYRVVARRFKTPVGEIDLIAKRGRTLAFVEVKGRKTYTAAAEAVHGRNQARVVRAAQWWLSRHGQYIEHEVRFDVCLIAWYRLPHHITHAFSATA